MQVHGNRKNSKCFSCLLLSALSHKASHTMVILLLMFQLPLIIGSISQKTKNHQPLETRVSVASYYRLYLTTSPIPDTVKIVGFSCLLLSALSHLYPLVFWSGNKRWVSVASYYRLYLTDINPKHSFTINKFQLPLIIGSISQYTPSNKQSGSYVSVASYYRLYLT